MKQVLIFAFWAIMVPFIAVFRRPDQVTEKQWAYMDSVKLPRSTAILTMACVALFCLLMIGIIVR